MIQQVKAHVEINKAPFIYKVIGPEMEHNYLCAVCREKSAVIEQWHGILQPCWDCQKSYKVVKKTWLLKILRYFK